MIILLSFLLALPLAESPAPPSVNTTPSGDLATRVWGWDAHKMVCAIAWWEMQDSTRGVIKDMLEEDAGYERFIESCLWADDVRGRLEEYDRWSTAHYVNLPRGAEAFDLERDCANTFCVVEGVLESRAVLSDAARSNNERLDALKFFAHFVGDIHQPLHAGYADDRGGNDTSVNLFGQDTNLHSTWDWGLISHTGLDWIDYASQLYFEISDEDRAKWESDDPGAWSKESYDIVSASAYNIGSGQIGQQYYDRHIGLIETRIKQAAVRLADGLDALLGE